VAAGAVARAFLSSRGVTILGYALEIGGVRAERVLPEEIDRNPARCPDPQAAPAMVAAIEKALAAGDSVGGIAEVRASGCPAGLGEPVFDKLTALLAHAFMSVGAVRGVEVGAGFGAARMRGSAYNDRPFMEEGRLRTRTNNAGGIAGGISTGEDIVVRAAIRPPASISLAQRTVDASGRETDVEIAGRHDPCIVPRAIPVLEAMAAIVFADCILLQQARSR
jgi:chorismate synthase